MYFISADTGWAAGGPNGWIRKTVNGGQSWTLQFTSPYYLRSIEFIDANTGFAGSLNGQLYRTTNGGTSWTDISPGISPAPDGICGLSAPTADVIYGCGLWAGPAYLIKSVNGGSTWTYTDMSAYATRLVDIHFTTPDSGFATGTANPASPGGVILHTVDGGASWTTVHTTNALTDIVWKIQRLDAMIWYASIYSEPTNDDTRMLRSTDGGLTWTQLLVANTYTYIEAIGFLDTMHGWTGGDNTLWETTDGGLSWELIPLGANYNRFFKVNDSTAYLSGQRIYKYRADISTSIADAEPQRTAHRLHVSPNPTNGRIIIDLTLDRSTIADLRIVSSNGTTEEQLMKRKADAGAYAFTVDLTDHSAGFCFVVLKCNEGMLYEKVVVK